MGTKKKHLLGQKNVYMGVIFFNDLKKFEYKVTFVKSGGH